MWGGVGGQGVRHDEVAKAVGEAVPPQERPWLTRHACTCTHRFPDAKLIPVRGEGKAQVQVVNGVHHDLPQGLVEHGVNALDVLPHGVRVWGWGGGERGFTGVMVVWVGMARCTP